MKLQFSARILEKYSNVKFHENLSSERPVVPCDRVDLKVDLTKLIIVVRVFANTPKNDRCFI